MSDNFSLIMAVAKSGQASLLAANFHELARIYKQFANIRAHSRLSL
jgi:hypothetical protein